SRQGQTRSRVDSSRPRKRVSMALLNNSAVRTRPTQKSKRHHWNRPQRSTMAAARTSAGKKKGTKKLEWPRTPSLMPRKATRNLLRHDGRGRGGSGSGREDAGGASAGSMAVVGGSRFVGASRPARRALPPLTTNN